MVALGVCEVCPLFTCCRGGIGVPVALSVRARREGSREVGLADGAEVGVEGGDVGVLQIGVSEERFLRREKGGGRRGDGQFCKLP